MVKIQKPMKQFLANLIRIAIIAGAIGVTIFASVDGWQTFGILIAGLIFRDFFSSKIYDPVFKDQSAQGWAVGEIKKWAARKRPTSKLDI